MPVEPWRILDGRTAVSDRAGLVEELDVTMAVAPINFKRRSILEGNQWVTSRAGHVSAEGIPYANEERDWWAGLNVDTKRV